MKSYALSCVVMLLIFSSCSSSRKAINSKIAGRTLGIEYNKTEEPFNLTVFAEKKTYGYTEKNPIKVGDGNASNGPLYERKYLNALAGPNGEEITYTRLGSCCMFKTKNGIMGGGMLDMYELKWKGNNKGVVLYINMYDSGEMKVPVGLTLKKMI